ncbi:MAG: molybdate ABC transporter substrate-binding protein [Anaerolineales bacterium]
MTRFQSRPPLLEVIAGRYRLGTWLLVASLAPFLTGCLLGKAAGKAPDDLIVYAASSLTDAFTAEADAFELSASNPAVALDFGASSQLAIQLLDGAPADIFASANEQQMALVDDAGLLIGPPIAFAANRLVLIVPADNPAGIYTLEDLARPGVRIVTAVPGVPVRVYTDDLLARLAATPQGAAFRQAYEGNLASEETNVRQTTAKVALGEADAAIVYASDASSDLASQLHTIPIPQADRVQPRYFVALLRGGSHPEQARAFVQFLLSDEGQEILQRSGFSPLEEHD